MSSPGPSAADIAYVEAACIKFGAVATVAEMWNGVDIMERSGRRRLLRKTHPDGNKAITAATNKAFERLTGRTIEGGKV